MTNNQKSTLKSRIQQELDTLRLSLPNIQMLSRCPDENELASRISECTLSENLNHRILMRINTLEKALLRMDTEDYGICEDCGDPIPFRRLFAAPDVVLCIQCQTEQDQQCRPHAHSPVWPIPRTRYGQHLHRLPYPEASFCLPPCLPSKKRKNVSRQRRQAS